MFQGTHGSRCTEREILILAETERKLVYLHLHFSEPDFKTVYRAAIKDQAANTFFSPETIGLPSLEHDVAK